MGQGREMKIFCRAFWIYTTAEGYHQTVGALCFEEIGIYSLLTILNSVNLYWHYANSSERYINYTLIVLIKKFHEFIVFDQFMNWLCLYTYLKIKLPKIKRNSFESGWLASQPISFQMCLFITVFGHVMLYLYHHCNVVRVKASI